MTHMRRLGCLLLQFRSVSNNGDLTADDMIKRENFFNLTQALEELCAADDGATEQNLQLALGYLLKKSGHVLQGIYLTEKEDDKYEEVGRFQKVLEYHWGELFGDAKTTCQIKLHSIFCGPCRLFI